MFNAKYTKYTNRFCRKKALQSNQSQTGIISFSHGWPQRGSRRNHFLFHRMEGRGGGAFWKTTAFSKTQKQVSYRQDACPTYQTPLPGPRPACSSRGEGESASPHFCRKCATLRHGIYGCQVLAENERFTRGVCDMRGLRIQNEPPCGGGQEGSTLGVLMRRPWPVRTVSALRAAWGL